VREVSGSRRHMVILIAHRLSSIAHADTIYVLERGRVIETGNHDALVEARGLYYAMWRQQIGERSRRLRGPGRGFGTRGEEERQGLVRLAAASEERGDRCRDERLPQRWRTPLRERERGGTLELPFLRGTPGQQPRPAGAPEGAPCRRGRPNGRASPRSSRRGALEARAGQLVLARQALPLAPGDRGGAVRGAARDLVDAHLSAKA